MIPTNRSLLGTLPQAFFRSILRSILPDCQTVIDGPRAPLHFIVNLSWEEYMCSIAAYTLLSFDLIFHMLIFFLHALAHTLFVLLIYSLYKGLY